MNRLIILVALQCVLFAGSAHAQSSLRFYGHGVAAPDLDRVKIRIDDPANNLPGPPADIGATDFTLEFWINADSVNNAQPERFCGYGIEWIYGNIILDRDRYNQSRKFGLSIANERLIWGVSGNWDFTICGTTDVLDNLWHHVAVARSLDGRMWIWVDGDLDAFSADGPPGDISYPDNGVPGPFCGGPCTNSDPFIVLGAEKHDAGSDYPSYNGYMDEFRISTAIRYSSPFTSPSSPFAADSVTAALYHFDEGVGDTIHDQSGAIGGPSQGLRRFGGSESPGPAWSNESPFENVLPAVAALVIRMQNDGMIHLYWNAVAGANSYRVYFSTNPLLNPPADGTLLAITSTLTFADDPAMHSSLPVYYRVIASTSAP